MGMRMNLFSRMSSVLRRFAHNTRGVASIELAIAMPIMLTLLLSAMEMTRYVIIHQKVERTAASIADLVAREEVMTETKLSDVFEITEQMLSPFQNEAGTLVIVSSVTQDTNRNPEVSWQRSWGGGNVGSKIGSEGGDATLPGDMTIKDGDNVIAAEVYYDFKPVFMPDILGANTIYKRAVYRPRFSSLASILNN